MKNRLAVVGATIALALSLLAPVARADHGSYRPPAQAARGACNGPGIGWNTMPSSLVVVLESAFDAHMVWNCEVEDLAVVHDGALAALCTRQGLDVLYTAGERRWISCFHPTEPE